MDKLIIYAIMFLAIVIFISFIIFIIIKKLEPTNNKKSFYSNQKYKKCCKNREKVIDNIPISFNASCELKESSDIYYFYDQTIENGIEDLKHEQFLISSVGRI